MRNKEGSAGDLNIDGVGEERVNKMVAIIEGDSWFRLEGTDKRS